MQPYGSLKVNFNRPKIWRKTIVPKKQVTVKSYPAIMKEQDDFIKYKKDVDDEVKRLLNNALKDSNDINTMSVKLADLFEVLGKSLIFDNDIDPQHLLKHTNKVTLNKKLQPWCRQLNMNVPYIIQQGYGIVGLLGKFKNVPAFVVAAGPSLKNNIAELKKVGNKGIIIAVDTSFRPLLDAGIIPHFVMAHDANHNGAKFFLPKDYFPGDPQLNDLNDKGLDLCLQALNNDKQNILKDWHYDTIGVFVNYVSPLTISAFCGDMLCFYSVWDPSLPVYDTMAKATNWYVGEDGIPQAHGKGGILGGSSVGHTAFYLANALGCNPISFLGLDLSYPGGKTYVEGASNQKDISKIKLVDVEDLSDRPVKTNISMFSYRTVLEGVLPHLIMQNNLTVYNCTENSEGGPAGILECGAFPRRLNSVIEEHCIKEIDDIKKIRDLIKQDRDGHNTKDAEKNILE